MMVNLRSLVILVLIMLAQPGYAQQFAQVSRERVLEADRFVDVADIGNGQVEVVVKAPSLVRSSWRFYVRAPNATADLSIHDIVSGQELASLSREKLVAGTWSPYLTSLTVIFQLPDTVEFEIEVIGFSQSSVDSQTPVGQLNLTSVLSADLPFALDTLTNAVGQLTVLEGSFGSDDAVFFTYCTAFMISPNHALTAEHCVSRGLEGKLAELVLGFVDPDFPDGVGRHKVAVLAKARPLDVALLTVTPPVELSGYFEVAADEPGAAAELLVLQHFGGEAMTLSRDEDCLVTGTFYNGPRYIFDQTLHEKKEISFGHGCDTTKSSSGAPVVDRETLEVVGVHQRGFHQGDAEENRALRRSVLRGFLDEHLNMDG